MEPRRAHPVQSAYVLLFRLRALTLGHVAVHYFHTQHRMHAAGKYIQQYVLQIV